MRWLILTSVVFFMINSTESWSQAGYLQEKPLIIRLQDRHLNMSLYDIFTNDDDPECGEEKKYRPDQEPASPTDPECCEDDPDCMGAPYVLFEYKEKYYHIFGNSNPSDVFQMQPYKEVDYNFGHSRQHVDSGRSPQSINCMIGKSSC